MKPQKPNTLQIPFANPAKVLHTSLPREEQIVRVLSVGVALLVVAYITLVSMSVVNVIASKEAGDEMSALRTVVSGLENDYFELSREMTIESGAILGLAPVVETHYVNRVGAVAQRARTDL